MDSEETLGKEGSPAPGRTSGMTRGVNALLRTEWRGILNTQNASGIFRLEFSDLGRLRITGTIGRETADWGRGTPVYIAGSIRNFPS